MPRADECRFPARLPSPCVRDIPGDSLWLLHIDMHIAMAPPPPSEQIWASSRHRGDMYMGSDLRTQKHPPRLSQLVNEQAQHPHPGGERAQQSPSQGQAP